MGLSLRWLSRIRWWAGSRAQAEASGAEAIEVLESAGDQRALALALSNQSQLHMLAGRRAECIAVGRRAVAMARDVGDAAVLSHALNNVGTALWDDGALEGQAMLEESLSVALEAGEVEHACRAYVNVVWHLMDVLRFAEADGILDDAIELAEDAEFDGFRRYLQLTRSMVYLALGRWDEAEREIRWAVDAEPIIRCPALVVLGTVQARRGRNGAALLEQAWTLALPLEEAQRTGHAAAALLEAAWLRGDASRVASVAAPAYEDVRRFGRLSAAAALGYLMRVAGRPVPINDSEHPYTCWPTGNGRRQPRRGLTPAARTSRRSLAPTAPTPQTCWLLSQRSTPWALAHQVRLLLRNLGVSRIPRGRVQATRDNPAGLTDRQTDVIRLLPKG